MHVPVEFGPAVEVGVVTGEELRREPWGDERVDGLVEGKGEHDFMDVVRERRKIQEKSIGPDSVAQPFRRWWNGV